MNAEQFTEMSMREPRGEGGQFGGKGSGNQEFVHFIFKREKGNILLFNKKIIIIFKKEEERIFLTL